MTRSVRGYLKVLAAFTMLSGLAQLFPIPIGVRIEERKRKAGRV